MRNFRWPGMTCVLRQISDKYDSCSKFKGTDADGVSLAFGNRITHDLMA
jgi:hypothetical protein